jgi:hypothetical protein
METKATIRAHNTPGYAHIHRFDDASVSGDLTAFIHHQSSSSESHTTQNQTALPWMSQKSIINPHWQIGSSSKTLDPFFQHSGQYESPGAPIKSDWHFMQFIVHPSIL